MALESLLGTVREALDKAAPPEVGSSLREFLDNVTEKLTGKPAGQETKADGGNPNAGNPNAGNPHSESAFGGPRSKLHS